MPRPVGICPHCSSTSTVPIARARRGRSTYRYRCARCLATWIGKRVVTA